MKIENNKINSLNFKALPAAVSRRSSQILASPKLSFSELKALKQEGVNQILDLRSSLICFPQLLEAFYCFCLGIKRKNIRVSLVESMPQMDVFKKARTFVDKPNTQTLIHCKSGLHRTNIFCEAIQLLKGEKKLNESLTSLKDNGFFVLSDKHKVSPKKAKSKIEFLNKRFEEFKQIFANFK